MGRCLYRAGATALREKDGFAAQGAFMKAQALDTSAKERIESEKAQAEARPETPRLGNHFSPAKPRKAWAMRRALLHAPPIMRISSIRAVKSIWLLDASTKRSPIWTKPLHSASVAGRHYARGANTKSEDRQRSPLRITGNLSDCQLLAAMPNGKQKRKPKPRRVSRCWNRPLRPPPPHPPTDKPGKEKGAPQAGRITQSSRFVRVSVF